MGNIDILHLIDQMEEALGHGYRLPLGRRLLVDGRRLLNIIDQLRVAVPLQVREAQEILDQRAQLLAQAREEAQKLIAQTQTEVEWLLSENSIVRTAQEKAQRLVQEAETEASELVRQAEAQAAARLDEAAQQAAQEMADADHYALETLHRLETEISQFLTAVRNGIASLERRR